MVIQKETKEKQKTRRETLGKFFYDLAKTTFAVMVVGNVVEYSVKIKNRLKSSQWLCWV